MSDWRTGSRADFDAENRRYVGGLPEDELHERINYLTGENERLTEEVARLKRRLAELAKRMPR